VRRSVTFTRRQGAVGVEEDEQIDGAVATIFAVIALKLTRLGGDRLTNLADELGRALVEADHRSLGIGRLGIEVEHILHAGDVFPVDLGDAPHVFAPGLQMVLRQPSTDGLRRQLFMVGEPDHLIGQQFEGPAGPSRWRL
jgi:hypothetical protein